MIRAVIIDDEQHSIDTLEWKLQHYCQEVKVVAKFKDPLKGIEWIKRNELDLLFLDIEMPRLSGFDVLEELGSPVSFDIIFVTAYDAFGIKAIKFSALDYLLKPVQNKELISAVKKHIAKGAILPTDQLNQLIKNVKAERSGLPGKIGLVSKEAIEYVEPEQIVLCEASSNYTVVYLADGSKRLISKTLKEFEEMLAPFGFYRPHNSYVIQLRQVKEYIRTDGGYLVMKSQQKVPISKNKKEQLLTLLSV